MAALAAAAALAITSTVIAVPVQAAPEELMNSTFEDGYGAWKGVHYVRLCTQWEQFSVCL